MKRKQDLNTNEVTKTNETEGTTEVNETIEGKSEEEAAIVIQSHFRGHQQRKQIKECQKTQNQDNTKLSDSPKEDAIQVIEEQSEIDNDGEEKSKAAIVIQSNYRGHRERKKLKEERQIDVKTDGEIQKDAGEKISQTDANSNTGSNGQPVSRDDEEKAATVIQSNYRGLREREKLKKEGKIPNKNNKLESDGTNNGTTSILKEMEDLAYFTEQVRTNLVKR